ncbi:hypothetical protein [Mesorhizobium sp. CAU 1741]|uniref:GumC family protein n=1 Tax=Mesorhizobium sp. CAU 1741 TaxID=3140366 RepID=UPI00325B1076
MSSRLEYPIPDRAPSLLSMVGVEQYADTAPAPNEHETAPIEEQGGGLRIVTGLTVAGAVLGAALTFAWPQTYVATSELLIDPNAMQLASVASTDASLAVVENQLRMLRSGVTLNAAVDRLNLSADPEFNGDAAGPFGITGALANFGDLFAGDGARTVEQRRRRAVERLAAAVEARREPASAVIAISVRSSDPQKSAIIANTMSGLFLDNVAGGSAGGAVAEDLRAELAAAERAVANFRTENGLPSADEAIKLGRELAAARDRTETLTAQAQLMGRGDLDMTATGSIPTDSSPSPLDAAIARQAEAKRMVDNLSAKLGPRHPDLVTARAGLDGAVREVELQKQQIAASLEERMQQAKQKQDDIASRLSGALGNGSAGEEKLATLRELERAAEVRRAAYEDAMSTSDGAEAAAAGLRVLSQAEAPMQAASPSMPTLTLAGGLGGMLAGLGFVGWRRAERNYDEQPVEGGSYDDPEHHHYHHSEAVWEADGEVPAAAVYQSKETEAMYPYPPHASPSAQAQNQGQPEPQPMGYAPAPQHPQMQQHAAPGWYPPVPAANDPWAHTRGYAPQVPPYYAQPGYGHPQGPTVVYVPVAAHPQQQSLPRLDHYERDRHMDRRTDAAIEEIRHSLRALREAIEDFADDRYGT